MEEGDHVARSLRKAREQREESVPVPDFGHLLEIARRDTGSSRRVAGVLLSLWSGDEFKCDLQGVLYLDSAEFDELLKLLTYLHRKNLQLDSLISEAEMQPIIAGWGRVFRRPE